MRVAVGDDIEAGEFLLMQIEVETASTYCSRNWLFTIASRKLRMPRFSVYQLGRGSEPVMVVGSMMSLVARSMAGISPGD